ncbi:hypothetical protein [Pleomorphovibrio marinus]|uniref:hypothetical protein n=1 Tax=Pleomorphovibrio marinus TaxID=2164132 RepID=UPI000E0C5144|nr:hypothetical protein [Pleomorphovibrio marinus]
MQRWVYLVLVLMSCTLGEHQEFERNPQGLEGTWKLVESAISTGGGLNVTTVKDERKITFFPNQTFVKSPKEDCGSGFFYFDGEELKLDIFCGEKEFMEQSQVYAVEMKKDFMKLTPVSPVCIEGCWFKFKKLLQ